MNKHYIIYFFTIIFVALVGCKNKTDDSIVITVSNNLELNRSFETVEISKGDLQLKKGEEFEELAICDVSNKRNVVIQYVDEDGDGSADKLLFQPEVGPKCTKKYKIVKDTVVRQNNTPYCFSRFVPERTDDYAWENDRVAFRVFGPNAQKLVEENKLGGTLSSGVDAWLKKVPYPIINNWYKKNDIRPGAYHEMSTEGIDNFHVGASRGVGGTAVKRDSVYYISRNFINWRVITTGPIRTSFELEYEDWKAGDTLISEKKHISLDYGNNLSKYEIQTSGTNTLSVGLTLHENDGYITENVKNGWISYWEPHDTSELGTAIVSSKGSMFTSDYYVTDIPDRSNLFAQLKVNENKVVYYSGFAWKESGQYPTKASWEKYLKEFSLKINNPLQVSYNKQVQL